MRRTSAPLLPLVKARTLPRSGTAVSVTSYLVEMGWGQARDLQYTAKVTRRFQHRVGHQGNETCSRHVDSVPRSVIKIYRERRERTRHTFDRAALRRDYRYSLAGAGTSGQ